MACVFSHNFARSVFLQKLPVFANSKIYLLVDAAVGVAETSKGA